MKPSKLRELISARRKGLKRDDRLDWRDPNMPVLITEELVDDWTGKVVDRRTREHDPWIATKMAQDRLMQSELNVQGQIDNPSWRNDPTYDLKRKR